MTVTIADLVDVDAIVDLVAPQLCLCMNPSPALGS